MLDDALMGGRFLRQLPSFLHHPVTLEEARATLRRRLENREADFLTLVKRAIYEHPPSPYRALLQFAGCEYGDLDRLVRHEGVEGALRALCDKGVYLTIDEFKGRREVVRGTLTLPMDPLQLRNPLAAQHLPVQSSGSRSDLHFLQDLVALIQPDADMPSVPADTLLLSALRSTAPLILINVSMGDRARVVERACGCPLQGLGWTRHLQNIRSDEKLTAGGMTFLDTDVVHVLEHLLPSRFGGGPTDYQIVEQDHGDGRARLNLVVHPRLGPLDAEAIVDAFLTGIGSGTGANHVMSLVWRTDAVVRVERRPPAATVSGTILHLHVSPPGAG
jgi:hypothetical protein